MRYDPGIDLRPISGRCRVAEERLSDEILKAANWLSSTRRVGEGFDL
jgi:hypothetical protein